MFYNDGAPCCIIGHVCSELGIQSRDADLALSRAASYFGPFTEYVELKDIPTEVRDLLDSLSKSIYRANDAGTHKLAAENLLIFIDHLAAQR